MTITKITEELQKTLGSGFKVAIVIESLQPASLAAPSGYSIDESKPIEEFLLNKELYQKLAGKNMAFGVRARVLNACGSYRVIKVGDLFHRVERTNNERTFAQLIIDSSGTRKHRPVALRNIGTSGANYFEDCLRIFGLINKVNL